jgi:phage major head subunit gpT-like protein
MIFTPQTLVDLQKRFSLLFENGFEANVPVFWDKKAERIDTPGVEINVLGWLAEMPMFRKWVGARQAKRLAARAFQVKNDDYEFSYAVSRNDIKYDRLGIYRSHFTAAGVAARVWKDQMLNVVQKAGKTSLCYDGQFFYDTDHPVDVDDPTKGTFINLRTAFALNADNVQTAFAYQASLKDANGEPMMIRADVIECNTNMRQKALEAVRADATVALVKNVAGTENVAAATKPNQAAGLVDIWLNDRIEDGVWYLHHVTTMRPFVVQIESDPTPLEMRVNPEDPHVWDNNEFLFGSRATGAATYTLPHLSVRCEE